MKHQPDFTCVVIDDEDQARFVMEQLLQQQAGVQVVASAADAVSGLQALRQHQPDVVFLDIKMPGISGLEMALELQQIQLPTRVVFVTAYDHFAIEALRLSAFDYLLKPVDPQQLKVVFEKLAKKSLHEAPLHEQYTQLLQHIQQHSQRLRFNTRTGFILIDPDEIVLVKADGNYSEILMSDNHKEVVSVSIGAVAEMLNKTAFFKASRSALIHFKFARGFNRKLRTIKMESHGISYDISIAREQVAVFERGWE